MELNEQKQTMDILPHAAKLGTVAQTKAKSLAQSQLQKMNQFTMYSTNIGGMHGMGSGGMQVPHMLMMNGMGGNRMMNRMWGKRMMNGMGGSGGFKPFQGMANQMYNGGMVSLHSVTLFIHDNILILNLNIQPFTSTICLSITGT
jgi:hypothetical protein